MNFTALDAYLDTLEALGKAGVDCAVSVNGRVVHRHMHGYADREQGVPIGEDTIYRMYSMTKPVTCVAVMQLYERGKFLMTDPVSAYLPEFKGVKVQHKLSKEAPPITMQHLLTMTAGLSYELFTPPLQRLYNEKPRFTTRDFVRAVAQTPLLFDPGTHWYYSLCHDVLGACVEVLSGQTFGQYLKENIFDPLGMADAAFHLTDAQRSRLCVRYGYDSEKGAFIPDPKDVSASRSAVWYGSPSMESGGAGLHMTVNDYMKFADMLALGGVTADGRRVIAADTLSLMRENHLTAQQMEDFDWPQHRGYGYGLGVRTLVSRAMAGALGDVGEFGWSGVAGTWLMVNPARRLAVVYAQQATPSGEATIHPRLRNLVYSGLGY